MSQKCKTFTVTVTTAGTRQRCVAIDSVYRYVKSASFIADHSNTGAIYLGDSAVASSIYAMRLDKDQSAEYTGDQKNPHPGDDNNLVDLYNTWVDSSVSGEKVHVTVQERA